MNPSNGRLVMLVGIAGAGKSTYAEHYSTHKCKPSERATVFSSDAIREEYYGDASIQGDNTIIFKELVARILHHLERGFTAIYDATNIQAKYRIAFLKEVRALNPNIECNCIFFPTPPKTCISRQEERDRVVPEDVIKRQYRQLEEPLYEEGWNKIYRAPTILEGELALYNGINPSKQ